MIWDHNRGLIYVQRVQPAYDDPEASSISGAPPSIGIPATTSITFASSTTFSPTNISSLLKAALAAPGPAAQRLSKSIITDLNQLDRGLGCLEPYPRPKQWPAPCRHRPRLQIGSTAVNANLTTGEVTYNPPFYVLGQFSRFIRPGAKRIVCTSNSDDLIATAALNPDGKIAVVVLNLTDHYKPSCAFGCTANSSSTNALQTRRLPSSCNPYQRSAMERDITLTRIIWFGCPNPFPLSGPK